MQMHRYMTNMLQINEESRNWFRLSKLIIDVGAEVLQNIVVENIQTFFLNEFVYLSLEKMQKVRDNNYAAYQWRSFKDDLSHMDETCGRSLATILKSWKLPVNQKLPFSGQVSKLQKWEKEIEIHLSRHLAISQPNAKSTLESWIIQIQNSISNLESISDILETLTTGFLELCQQSRQDLLRDINKHDLFLSTSKDSLLKARFESNEAVKERINNLESERKKMLQTWKMASNRYFNSLRENIKDFYTKFEKKHPLIADIPELKILLGDLKNAANEIDGTELLKSCDAWHQELHDLFGKLLNNTDNESVFSIFRANLIHKELKQFRSISSQQVKDFFDSDVHKTELQILKKNKHISEKQYTKLHPSSAFPDIKEWDTTLLVIILKNCLLYPPTHGWNEEPPESDQSLGADILRLKSFRNSIVEYIATTRIVQKKFDKLWLNVKQVLCRLAIQSGDKYVSEVTIKIDRFKTSSFNPERDTELIRILDWCRNDILAEFKGLAQTHQCLNMLDSIEKAERERLSRRRTAETYVREDHTDEVTTLPQGLRAGWESGNRVGGPVVGAVAAVGGAVGGLFIGIGRTLFKD